MRLAVNGLDPPVTVHPPSGVMPEMVLANLNWSRVLALAPDSLQLPAPPRHVAWVMIFLSSMVVVSGTENRSPPGHSIVPGRLPPLNLTLTVVQ